MKLMPISFITPRIGGRHAEEFFGVIEPDWVDLSRRSFERLYSDLNARGQFTALPKGG
jgi:hypothetical protein